jgi:DNA repair exonuclease SbcCD ATPase subunit
LIRKFKRDDFTTKLAELEVQYSQSIRKYNNEKDSLVDIDKTITDCTKKLIQLNGDLVKLNSDLVGIDELLKRKRLLEQNRDNAIEAREKIETRLTKLEELQIQLEDVLDDYDEEDLRSKLSKITKKKGTWLRLKSEIDKYNIKKESLQSRIDHLNTHKYNPDCDICLDNNKSIIETKSELDIEFKTLNKNLSDMVVIEETLNNEISELLHVEKEWETFKNAHDKEIKVSGEINNIHSKLSASETRELDIKHQIQNQENLIKEYYKNEKQIKLNQKLRGEMIIIRDELKSAEGKKSEVNNIMLSLNGRVSSLKTQKENIEERIEEVKNLESQTKLFDYYLNALGKDGVSYELVEKALPMIEGEVNNILGQIVEFGMQIEIDGRNINAYIVYNDQRWSLEMCSGMEKFISGLAIRVALINVCNLPRPNFLVIDEGFGTLDSENLQSLFMLFTYLKTQFDFVMVISHIDSMRDVVDDLIEIKKEDGFSHVKY